jgi:hypothetical protein
VNETHHRLASAVPGSPAAESHPADQAAERRRADQAAERRRADRVGAHRESRPGRRAGQNLDRRQAADSQGRPAASSDW